MAIKFKKQYPEFSKIPYCMDVLNPHKNRVSPSFLIYIALFLNDLPNGSLIVYSGPYKGWSLVALIPLLRPHRVVLIENYRGEPADKYRHLLSDSVRKTSRSVDVKLIEADFVEVWGTLSDVDFLLLDGPPNTTNFEPFSENFIFIMHDINQRLRGDYPGDSLAPYGQYLCRADDKEQFAGIQDKALHPVLKHYRDIDRENRLWKEFGPHAWFKGRKYSGQK